MLHPHIGELMPVGVTGLLFCIFEMYCPFVEPHGCTSLHPSGAYPPACNRLCKMIGSRFCNPAPCHFMMADVHESVEEGSCGDDNSASTELDAPDRSYADCFTVLYDELVGLVLPDVEIIGVVEDAPPFPNKFSAVALGAG